MKRFLHFVYETTTSLPTISESGNVYTFGEGSSGQLGHGTHCLQISVPKKLNLKYKFRAVSCGENHTSIISGKNWSVVEICLCEYSFSEK